MSKGSRGYYRLYCSVCKIKFQLNDRVIRTNTSKYIHVGCHGLFRFDSQEKITDEELDNFFSPDMTSNKEQRLRAKEKTVPK
jgi:hypothetical protein